MLYVYDSFVESKTFVLILIVSETRCAILHKRGLDRSFSLASPPQLICNIRNEGCEDPRGKLLAEFAT